MIKEHEDNKKAWEEVFDKKKDEFGSDIVHRCQNEVFPFLQPEFVKIFSHYNLKAKTIAHFCCNNGRELLSLMQAKPRFGVGFDIAQNMMDYANMCAKELSYNCEFVQSDILAIDSKYNNTFDVVIITIGALTWFKDLHAFFEVVNRTLKSDGLVFINESHPFTNMLAMPGEDGYDKAFPNKVVNSYFKEDPWVEVGGIDYISDPNQQFTQTFTSYSHTLTSILNSMNQSNLQIVSLNEYENDITGSFSDVSNQGYPLSYVLVSKKST